MTAGTAIVLLAPGLVLALFGWSQFRDGVALDEAVPVPVYMIRQSELPKTSYIEAARSLRRANPRDGDAAIEAAEARMLAGSPAADVVPEIVRGLEYEPSSARGWTLLAEGRMARDERGAAHALELGFVTAPRDYWIAGRRAGDAAVLWPWLDDDGRAMALAQVKLLWTEPRLHEQLLSLLKKRDGSVLVTRTFGEDDIRAINRWHSRMQLTGKSP